MCNSVSVQSYYTKCKNFLLTIHLYEEEEPIVRRVESTKEVDIYLNLIGKHKPEIHISIKNMKKTKYINLCILEFI